MRGRSLLPIALTLSFGLACAPSPKHRSWSEFTQSRSDNNLARRYIESAELEALRANALATRDFMTVAYYASRLGLYLWEIDPLLDARDRAASDSEYKYSVPPEYADFDRDARIAEIEGLIEELDANGNYVPVLDSVLAFIRGDCDAMVDEWARVESCNSFPARNYFDTVRASCGEEGVPKVCRVALDRMADADQKYRLMKVCNETMRKGNAKSRERLGQWATAEELESANANRPTIDDDGTQIPTDTVRLVLTNQCERDIAYQLGHSMVDGQSARTLLPAKEPLTLELPRCSLIDLYRTLDSSGVRATIRMTRGWTLVLKSDCETFRYERET